jgi:hypothetical protein
MEIYARPGTSKIVTLVGPILKQCAPVSGFSAELDVADFVLREELDAARAGFWQAGAR